MVSCRHCGETWPRDPAETVPCPKCHANAGARCKRPSGHECPIHAERDAAALAAGVLRPCPKAPAEGHPFRPVPNQTGCAVCGYARGEHPTVAQLRTEPRAIVPSPQLGLFA